MMSKRKMVAGLLGAVLLVAVGIAAGIGFSRLMDLPPADGMGLAAIVESVERKDLGVVQSVEYERAWWQLRGVWEVRVCKVRCIAMEIDPMTGAELRRKSEELKDELPPSNTRTASHVARSFEAGRVGHVTEIEFEHGAWQVRFRDRRGLLGALQPDQRRVLEPTPISLRFRHRAPASPGTRLIPAAI
jgi:hypothetical protein